MDPGESVSSLRFLDVYRVIAYYGNPLTPDMGIVGQYPPEEVVRRLKAQADVYRPLSPDREIIPAIDLVYAVAQLDPGPDGQYLLRMGDGLVQDWIRITKEEGILLFLDIQIGRSTVEAEVSRVLPFLSEEHVHLALDPEFAWGSTETPGVDIGHLDGADVNRAIDLVDQYVAREKLGKKVLVVHQFSPGMLTNRDSIRSSGSVDVVIDGDGFGAPAEKLAQWKVVMEQGAVQRAGVKLFYEQDAAQGGLLSEEDVMELRPTPLIIIYQ